MKHVICERALALHPAGGEVCLRRKGPATFVAYRGLRSVQALAEAFGKAQNRSISQESEAPRGTVSRPHLLVGEKGSAAQSGRDTQTAATTLYVVRADASSS